VESEGQYLCERCGLVATCSPRYSLNVGIVDHTGSQYVKVFDPYATKILGHSAEFAQELLNQNESQLKNLFQSVYFLGEYHFRLKYRVDPNDPSRIGFTASSVYPLESVSNSREFLQIIQAYS